MFLTVGFRQNVTINLISKANRSQSSTKDIDLASLDRSLAEAQIHLKNYGVKDSTGFKNSLKNVKDILRK